MLRLKAIHLAVRLDVPKETVVEPAFRNNDKFLTRSTNLLGLGLNRRSRMSGPVKQ